LVDRIDVDQVVERIDVQALVHRIDVQQIVDEIDINALIDRVDIDRIVSAIDVDQLVASTELGNVIAKSTTSAVTEGLDLIRSQGVGLDDFVTKWINKILRRPQAVIAGPPLLHTAAGEFVEPFAS